MPPATRGRTFYCVFCGGPRDKTSCEKKCLIWPQFLQIPLEIQQNTGRTRTTPSFTRTCESRISSKLFYAAITIGAHIISGSKIPSEYRAKKKSALSMRKNLCRCPLDSLSCMHKVQRNRAIYTEENKMRLQ